MEEKKGLLTTLDSSPLWRRIVAFQFDELESELPFVARLARENGWSLHYAERAIEEYRRFLFLTQMAGHAVTPSDEVDQVWHMHLLYTRSYWQRLCLEVLGAPLHHEPTRGGGSERAKFIEWYSRTLQSYRRLLEADPPEDLWPAPADRFGRQSRSFRRVSLAQHWVVPKRRALPWAMSAGAALLILFR